MTKGTALDETRLASIVREVIADPKVSEAAPESVSYIVRLSGGVGNHFGFLCSATEPPTYWVPGDSDPFRAVRAFYRSLDPRPEQFAFVLKVSLASGGVDLAIYYDTEARPWFVPIGEEDSLAELAR